MRTLVSDVYPLDPWINLLSEDYTKPPPKTYRLISFSLAEDSLTLRFPQSDVRDSVTIHS